MLGLSLVPQKLRRNPRLLFVLPPDALVQYATLPGLIPSGVTPSPTRLRVSLWLWLVRLPKNLNVAYFTSRISWSLLSGWGSNVLTHVSSGIPLFRKSFSYNSQGTLLRTIIQFSTPRPSPLRCLGHRCLYGL